MLRRRLFKKEKIIREIQIRQKEAEINWKSRCGKRYILACDETMIHNSK